MTRLTLLRTVASPVIALVFVCSTGCGGGSKLQEQSNANMRALAEAVWEYCDADGKYPDNLNDPNYLEDLGGENGAKVLAGLMVNPLTGDNPGYEYEKPPDGTPLSESDVIIIYQLRNGVRDITLPGATLGGQVRMP